MTELTSGPALAEPNRTGAAFRPLDYPPIRPSETALVVVDMTNSQVPRHVGETPMASPYFVDRLRELAIPNQVRLLEACRQAGVRVVFLRVGCQATDYADSGPRLRAMNRVLHGRDGTEATRVIEELAPRDGELSLLKTGSSGFTTANLDLVLRNMSVRHVLYTGVVTNACVMLTIAGGFDLGYYGYLVTDATATRSPDLQRDAESVIGEFMANIVTTDDILDEVLAP